MNASGIETGVAVLRDNLERLAALPQASLPSFAADFRNVDSALHRLQTAIHVLVAIGSYKVARRSLALPDSSRAVVTVLEADDAVPAGTADRHAPLFAFHDCVVHLDEPVDSQRVFDILTQHRHDLGALLDLLLAIPD